MPQPFEFILFDGSLATKEALALFQTVGFSVLWCRSWSCNIAVGVLSCAYAIELPRPIKALHILFNDGQWAVGSLLTIQPCVCCPAGARVHVCRPSWLLVCTVAPSQTSLPVGGVPSSLSWASPAVLRGTTPTQRLHLARRLCHGKRNLSWLDLCPTCFVWVKHIDLL